jgi:hypothetical protein
MHPTQAAFVVEPYGEVRLYLAPYAEGKRVALVALDQTGEQVGVLTTNLPEIPLEAGEFFVKTWSENEELAKAAMESGWFNDTGKRHKTGFVEAQIWKWKPLKQYISELEERMKGGDAA